MARPLKEINWEMVEKLVESGCTGVEIADTFRIDTDTFYDRFKREYNESFSGYSAKFYSAGIGYQKYITHMRALSKNGSIQLLLRYNEERLGWGKNKEIKPPNEEDFEKDHTIMQQANELRKQANEIRDLKEIAGLNADKSETR